MEYVVGFIVVGVALYYFLFSHNKKEEEEELPILSMEELRKFKLIEKKSNNNSK